MEVGSKSADSSSTVFVPSAISLSSPPMMPATALGRSESQIMSIVWSSFLSTPSSVFIVSPSRAHLTTMRRSLSFVWSNACMGCPSSSIT